MISLRAQALAILMLMTPFFVCAQSFKCKSSEGKVIYLDSPCPAGTTLETTIQSQNNGSSVRQDYARQQMPSYMPDNGCVQETKIAVDNCGGSSNNIARQCMKGRLSPSCLQHYESGPGAIRTADEKCQEEIRAAATPCSQKEINLGRQCVQEKLSARCREQSARFSSENEKTIKKCQEIMLQLKQQCPGSGEAFIKCMQEHQSEIKAACKN